MSITRVWGALPLLSASLVRASWEHPRTASSQLIHRAGTTSGKTSQEDAEILLAKRQCRESCKELPEGTALMWNSAGKFRPQAAPFSKPQFTHENQRERELRRAFWVGTSLRPEDCALFMPGYHQKRQTGCDIQWDRQLNGRIGISMVRETSCHLCIPVTLPTL